MSDEPGGATTAIVLWEARVIVVLLH